MQLADKILEFARKQDLFTKNDSILVACSGGKDSMALCHLLLELKVNFGVAYFDHETRNGQSKQDGEFVRAFAQKENLAFHSSTLTSFISIKSTSNNFQDEAREKRYGFLQSVADEMPYKYVATAHHAQDVIETFFMNVSRGSGLRGLTSIPAKRGNIIRPLLSTPLREIESYVQSKKIDYVQDQSNFENSYKRNQFRNIITPLLQEWDKSFDSGVMQSIGILNQTKSFIEAESNIWLDHFASFEHDIVKLPLKVLQNHHNPEILLYTILSSYGFTHTQSLNILGVSQNGKIFISPSHQALYHNHHIEISSLSIKTTLPFTHLTLEDLEFHNQEILTGFDYIEIDATYKIEKLSIRYWENGDYIQTNVGRKKLKRIFSEAKVRIPDKKRYQLLAYGQEILWIFNLRKSHCLAPNKQYLYVTKKTK